MLYDIVDNQRPEHNKANEHEFKEGSFPFIPHGLERTMEDLYNLKNALPEIKEWSGHRKKRLRSDRPSRFLDAGCGPGNIMLAAHTISLVDNYHGIEFFPETFDRAKSLLGVDNGKAINRGMKLFKDDILKFSKYKDYDIIYYYCPFADPQRQVLFEEKVEDDMRIGAILLGNLKKSGAVRKDYRFKLLPGQFADAAYIKIKGGKRKVSGVKKQSER